MPPLLNRLAALALLFAGTFAAAGSAQQTLPTPQPAIAVPAPAALKPALWQIADRDTTVYFFGTIHALPPGLEWLDGPVANALERSDELVTEVREPQAAELQALLLSKALLPQGQSLRAMLAPGERTAFEAAMVSNGLPVGEFDRLKPWYAALSLATLPLMREGYATENGVEGQLAGRAKALGKRVGALETMEFQLAMFDTLPPASQLRFLSEVVAGQADLRKELDQIVSEWGQGNATRLADLLNADNDDPATRKALITDRNRAWTEWVRARMRRPGVVFLAVGAGHLAGKGSVLELVGKAGWRVKRVQ